MAQIIKFPAQASKFGYKRVRKRAKAAENQNQLDLFPRPTAQILDFASELSRFEQALLFDERGDPKAAELYAKAIEAHDCVADAYCNLGIIESQNGNTSKALDHFTASLKHDPRHSESNPPPGQQHCIGLFRSSLTGSFTLADASPDGFDLEDNQRSCRVWPVGGLHPPPGPPRLQTRSPLRDVRCLMFTRSRFPF